MSGTLQPANHRDRVAASAVDTMLVVVLGAIAVYVAGGADPSLRLGAMLLAIGLPTFVVEATTGRSPGKAGLQLRHAQPQQQDEVALSLGQAAGRFTLKWVVPTLLLVFGLWAAAIAWWVADYAPALGRQRRTAHDRLTRSRVLGPTDSDRRRAEGS